MNNNNKKSLIRLLAVATVMPTSISTVPRTRIRPYLYGAATALALWLLLLLTTELGWAPNGYLFTGWALFALLMMVGVGMAVFLRQGNRIVRLKTQVRDMEAEIKSLLTEQTTEADDRTEELNETLAALEEAQQQLEEYTERELQRSQNLFESVVNQLPVLLAVLDRHQRIQYSNRDLAEMLGQSPENLLYKLPHEVCRGTMMRQLQPHLAHIYQTGVFQRQELMGTFRQELVPHTVEFSLVPLKDYDGSVERVIIIGYDLTERLQLEDALRTQHNLNTDILQSTTDGFIVLGPDWTVLDINPAGEQLGALPKHEVLGRNHWELWPDGQRLQNRFWTEYHRVMEERVTSRFVEYYPSNDYWIEISAFPMQSGGIGIFYRDVSETHRMARNHERTSQRLQEILQTTSDGYCLIGYDYRFLDLNGNYAKLVHLKREELLGRHLLEVFPGAGRQGSQFVDTFRTALEDRQPAQTVEYFAPLDLWVELRCLPVSEGMAVFVRDITALQRTQHSLRDSLREKEILLAEIHHRVKNNLAIVSGLLRLQASQVANPQLASLLAESNNRVHAIAMIHEKLYQSETLSSIDFAQYLPDLLASIRDVYESQNLQLETRLDMQPLHLDITTAVPLGLLLNELVSNAYKHAFPHHAQGVLNIVVRSSHDGCTVLVTDNGIGLKASHHQGLGFQLINGLVAQLEGTIAVSEPVQGGTQFLLHFPKLLSQPAPKPLGVAIPADTY